MTKATKRMMALGLALGLGLGATACSVSIGETIDEAAVKVIEGDIAEQLGQGALTGACDPLDKDAEIGSTFSCTGTQEDGTVIDFTAEKTGDRTVTVRIS